MHFIPLCEAPRPESKLRPFAVKSNTPLCAVQGFLLSLSLLLNVMLFCMCIFNGVSNTQGTPLHLALPQIYIFHIYTGPKFTQIPDLHGTHIYTGLFSHIDPKKQIYTNQLYTKPKFTQNLFFKFCIKLYQVNSSELDIFGYFLFAKKSPKNDIKCTF